MMRHCNYNNYFSQIVPRRDDVLEISFNLIKFAF